MFHINSFMLTNVLLMLCGSKEIIIENMFHKRKLYFIIETIKSQPLIYIKCKNESCVFDNDKLMYFAEIIVSVRACSSLHR